MSAYNTTVTVDVGKHPTPFIERQMMIRRERTPDMAQLKENEWNYVFVYGTLKENYSNHQIIPKDAKYLGRGHTREERYKMYTTGGFPVIEKLDDDSGNVVYGEVYAVRAEAFLGLDALESNGYMYLREKTVIKMIDQKIKDEKNTYTPLISCWMYVGMKEHWSNFNYLTAIEQTLQPNTSRSGLHFIKAPRA